MDAPKDSFQAKLFLFFKNDKFLAFHIFFLSLRCPLARQEGEYEEK